MNRKTKRLAVLVFVAMCLGMNTGCQVDLTGHVGSKAFYPDSIGNTKIGDPRRPMYEGSGYGEGIEINTTGKPGFQGMRSVRDGGGQ